MVTQAIPSQQIVTGSDILNLGALLAQTAAQTQLAFQDQAGYYDPSLFGSMNGFQPTLGRDQLSLQRDQLNATIADAQRQYNLDVQRFGLETANLNYQQRLGEAQTRLQQLGLLSSLRGPADYLAYNYVLNNMAAPPGQAVDPFKMTQGLNQPYVAPPLPNVPQPPPTTAPRPSSGTGGGTGGGGGGAPSSSSAAPRAVAPPSSTGIAISGNPQADASLRNQWASQGADPATLAEFDRISKNMADTYARAVANNPNFQLFDGGIVQGGSALVGDSKSGKPTGHEELVVSDYPFAVLPHDVIKGSEMNAPRAANGMFPNFQFPAGFGGQQGSGSQQQYNHQSNYGQYNGQMPDVVPSPVEQPGAGYPQQGYPGMNGSSLRQFWQQYAQNHNGQTPQTPPQAGTLPQVPAYLQSIMSWIQQRPAAGGNMMDWIHAFPGYPQTPVSAATGGTFTGSGADPGQGFFNFNTHTPAQTQNAPFVQQTLGNQSSPAFQQRGQPLGPFGAQPFSYTNYLSLLPSAQQMLQGYIETPTAMGGLAGNFQDELERSRRAAGVGMSFGPSTYGG